MLVSKGSHFLSVKFCQKSHLTHLFRLGVSIHLNDFRLVWNPSTWELHFGWELSFSLEGLSFCLRPFHRNCSFCMGAFYSLEGVSSCLKPFHLRTSFRLEAFLFTFTYMGFSIFLKDFRFFWHPFTWATHFGWEVSFTSLERLSSCMKPFHWNRPFCMRSQVWLSLQTVSFVWGFENSLESRLKWVGGVNFPYRENSLESRLKWVGGVSHQTFSLYNVNVWFSIKCTHFRIVFSSTNFTLILKFGKVKHRGKTISTLSSENVECRVNLGLGYTNGETEKREWVQEGSLPKKLSVG